MSCCGHRGGHPHITPGLGRGSFRPCPPGTEDPAPASTARTASRKGPRNRLSPTESSLILSQWGPEWVLPHLCPRSHAPRCDQHLTQTTPASGKRPATQPVRQTCPGDWQTRTGPSWLRPRSGTRERTGACAGNSGARATPNHPVSSANRILRMQTCRGNAGRISLWPVPPNPCPFSETNTASI